MSSASTDRVCIANIGPAGRHQRLLFGGIMLGVGIAASAVLIAAGLPRWWRLLLFFPLWGAALGFFQAREKT